jgi:hypothetical protein
LSFLTLALGPAPGQPPEVLVPLELLALPEPQAPPEPLAPP